MGIKFRWLGYVCFEMILPSGKVLIIDPYIDPSPTSPIKCGEITGADYIAITHGHYDHVTDVGPLVRKFNAKVICSHQVAEPLANFFDLDPNSMIRVTAGNVLEFEDLRVEVKKAEHISLVPVLRTMYRQVTGEKPDASLSLRDLRKAVGERHASSKSEEAPGGGIQRRMAEAGIVGGEQLNFAFRTQDNLCCYIYSAGPEDYLEREVAAAHPNVIFVQLGGVDPGKAAEVAARSGAELVIPTHHDGEGVEAMHKNAREMEACLSGISSARFLDIDHGRWYEVGVQAIPM